MVSLQIFLMSLYKSKYRIESTRLDVWDYSKYGYYFITICTKEKKNLFGSIVEDKVLLNGCGEIVKEIWFQIPQQFEDVELDEFVVMPNHIHGIVFISRDTNDGRDAINSVSTGFAGKKNPMVHKIHLSRVIRWFKGRTTYEIHHKLQFSEFAWQPRFYEHIIRNEKSLQKIREYISLNPLQWTIDEENPNSNSFIPTNKFHRTT